MTDVLTPEQRKRCMTAIRGKHTKPELLVRAFLRQMGFRYSLHRKSLPGKPDIVLPKQKTAIFVHGCFWHMHRCRYGKVVPATNKEFWQSKRLGNVERDKRKQRELRKAGWHVFTIWECLAKNTSRLEKRLRFLLGNV
jgi:DNA mismatch endonuclease, patch repair protein